MSREKMVTRTVKSIEVVALMCDVTNARVYESVFTLTDCENDAKTIEKRIRKNFTTSEHAFVAVKSVTEREALYGMTEVDFLRHAILLPPRG